MENYYLKERKNFSKESEKLVERIKDGYTPTDKEVLFLITSEEWQKKNKDQLDLKDELRKGFKDKNILKEEKVK